MLIEYNLFILLLLLLFKSNKIDEHVLPDKIEFMFELFII